MRLGQPGDVVDDLRQACLDSAMVAVDRLGDVVFWCGRIVEQQAASSSSVG